jgi:hypothetical protein
LGRRQYGAQAIRIVDPVLQAEHKRVWLNVWFDLRAGGFRVGRLHAEQDQVRATNCSDIRAGLEANVLVESPGLHSKSIALNCLHVLLPADQGHCMARAGEHASVVAADGARAHDGNFEWCCHA